MKKVWKYKPEDANKFFSEGFSVEVTDKAVIVCEDWGYTDELYSDGVQVRIPIWSAAEVAEFIASHFSKAIKQ